MTISDNQPITFWLNGVESFNQKIVPGKMQVCFCGRWKTTDTIRVQVIETVYTALTLKIWNDNDEEVGSVDFTEVSDVFDVSFTLAGEAVTDEHVYFTIEISASTMAALSTWTNEHTGSDWSLGSNPSRTLGAIALSSTKYLATPFSGLGGYEYEFSYDFDIVGYINLNAFNLYLLDSDFNVVDTYNLTTDIIGDGNYSGVAAITPSGYFAYIGFKFQVADVFSDVTIDINSVSYISDPPVYEPIAESDCFDIDDEDDESFLIQYSNEHNFAELDYSAGTIFGIRVHASFFNERSPQEDEAEEMSDKVVEKLSSSVKDQRQLQVEPAPFYFHKKLKRILQHNTVYLDDKYWVMEENYEIQEISQRQPLQKGSVWLTERTGKADTNIYGTLTNI